MNAPLPQASYPCGNFSDTSSRKKEIGDICIGTNQSKVIIRNFAQEKNFSSKKIYAPKTLCLVGLKNKTIEFKRILKDR